MSDSTLTLLILAASVVLFVWNRLPVGTVALLVAVSLWATDIISADEAIAGFGSSTVVLIASLFVVAEALDAAGVTTWAGQQMITHAGDSRTRLLTLLMVTVALLSALITPNGAAAALIPMVVVLAVRLGRSPSQLLMPLAFAAHAGSLLVLTGSPVSILASNASDEAGGGSFGFFEVTLVGVPLLLGTIAIAIALGSRLLPDTGTPTFFRDLSALPGELSRQYVPNDQLVRFTVGAGSPFIGRTAADANLVERDHVYLLSLQDSRGRPKPDEPVESGDAFVARGNLQSLRAFAGTYGLTLQRSNDDDSVECGLVSRHFGVAEVIVAPRSRVIGERVTPGMVTDSGQLVILAIQQHGQNFSSGEIALSAGDSLLLQGPWDKLDLHTKDPNFILVDSPDAIRRQTIPLGPKAVPALIVLAGMIALLTSGLVPAVMACLLAAMTMVVLRVVTVKQAHLSMDWTTLILIAGMTPLSLAITQTGAAEKVANRIVDLIGDGGNTVILLAIFLITATLGQMISNTATALIMIPIALSVAAEMNLSVTTVMMCLTVAAAASFMTPVATPANMMVMGPAGYKFGDYWKFGLPMMLLYLVVAVFLVPLIWQL